MSDTRRTREKKLADSLAPFKPASPRAYDGWQNDFLDLYEEEKTIAATCARLDIEPGVVQGEISKNPVFRSYVDECFERITDQVEKKAIELALKGTDVPIIQRGVEVGVQTREYPELIQFLLRTRRPMVYSEKLRVAHALRAGERGQTAADQIVESLRQMRESVNLGTEPGPLKVVQIEDADE